jgi:tetratricopeptide (TPR) repeat protein
VTSDSLQTTPYAFLASFYQQQGSADSAIWAYENLARLRPDDYGVWYELGELHARQGRFLEAQQAVREALSLRPDGENLMAYVRMGELYEQRQIPDSAILMFKTAHTYAPDNLVLNRLLTSYYVATDSFDLALPHAQAVVRTAPMERAGCRRLALIYYVLDSLTVADSILTSLVEGGDEDPVNHAYLGRIAAQREDYSTAREQFQKALSLADSVSDAYLDLGYAMNRLGQVDGEVSLYQSGLLKVTDSLGTVRLLMALASVLERSGRGDESIPVLERLLKAAPNDAAGLNFLGYLLAERGQRLEYAKGLIERAVAQEPTNAAFLDSYGWVYYQLREFDSALVYLKQAAELDNDPTILDHLGDAYEATGNRILALDCWRRALDLAPDNEAIKQKIGE